MNWLITGGCGFIGTNLVRQLQKRGIKNIRVVDNLLVGTRKDLAKVSTFKENSLDDINNLAPNGLEFIEADILDSTAMNKVGVGVDVIVHLAANTGVGPSVEDPFTDCRTNVLGTLNVLDSARLNGVKSFVFASSGAPLGEVVPPIHEEMVPKPVSPYGASKLAGEGYCSSYFKCFDVNTSVLRFGNVYGPGSLHKSSVVAKFIGNALDKKPIIIYGSGGQTRDFIFIDDLLESIWCAATTTGVGGNVFQIATNKETTVSELAKQLVVLLVKEGISKPEIIFSDPRQGDVMRNYSDTSKANNLLGWKAVTDLESGLLQTIRYFANCSQGGAGL